MQTLPMLSVETGSGPEKSPVLAKTGAEPADRETLHGLRRFYLGGPDTGAGKEWMDRDILPALMHPYRAAETFRIDYPVFLPPETRGEDPGPGCVRSLTEFLRDLAPADASKILGDNLDRLEKTVRGITALGPGTADAREILGRAGEAMRKDLKLSPEHDGELAGALEAMAGAVPAGGVLVSLTRNTPLDLLRHAAQCHARSTRAAFRKRTRTMAEKIRLLLESDRMKRPEGRDPKRVEGMVGEVSSRFLDSGNLARMMGTPRSTSLSDDRRERLETALAQLEDETPTSDARLLTLVHDGSLEKSAEKSLRGWQVLHEGDPCAAAARCFDLAAESLAEVIRAERLARLELDGNYDPDRHGPVLERLDWHRFSAEELRLIPPIVALVSSDYLVREGLLSLSQLLLSGRPVHVLVIDHPEKNPGSEGARFRGNRFEPGYLGMSLREAWVQQTSSSRPAHMVSGFFRALRRPRPGLHVVSPGFQADGKQPRLGSWFQAGAALESRAHPSFQYDPDAGYSWARRLDFSGNPQPEADWPVYELSAKTDGGQNEVLNLAFTFADFALLDPAHAGHFRMIPDGIAENELAPVDRHLDLSPEEAATTIPFVWGVDGTGTLRRLAVTAALVRAARDRLAYWRTLQELAGFRNEYALEAAARARTEAEEKARKDAEAVEEKHREELERLRRDAAEEVVTELTAALLDVDASALAAPTLIEGLGGRSVDEITEVLLQAVRPETLDEESAGPAGTNVEQAAARLMEALDPDRLEENPS